MARNEVQKMGMKSGALAAAASRLDALEWKCVNLYSAPAAIGSVASACNST